MEDDEERIRGERRREEEKEEETRGEDIPRKYHTSGAGVCVYVQCIACGGQRTQARGGRGE